MRRKLRVVFTSLLLVALLAGCGAKDGQVEESKNGEVNPGEVNSGEVVTLGEYKGFAVTAPSKAVKQEEVNNLIMQVYYSYQDGAPTGITDRAVLNGDMVNIDYEGKVDGVAFDGGTAKNQQLIIGSNSFITGFESGLVGVNPGETVDLNLVFPDPYHSEELAGKPVVFTVTVNYIYSTDYSDDVVAGWGEAAYTSVEEMKTYIEDYLKQMAQSNYDYAVENSVMSQFLASCTFGEIPQDVVEEYTNDLKTSLETQAAGYGMDAETLCQYQYGMTLSKFLEVYGKELAKQRIALQTLADKENLNKSDAELDTAISEAATENGFDSVEEFMGENTRDDYREVFMVQDALQFLIDNAVITEE